MSTCRVRLQELQCAFSTYPVYGGLCRTVVEEYCTLVPILLRHLVIPYDTCMHGTPLLWLTRRHHIGAFFSILNGVLHRFAEKGAGSCLEETRRTPTTPASITQVLCVIQ